MRRRGFLGVAGGTAACIALPTLARGGFAAFAAPDFPQTRKLHDELLALAEADLVAHGLALRFVPMPQNNEPLLAERMKELVAQRPTLIFAASERITVEAKRHAGNIPIVFATLADPVRTGIVASLSKPGGNLTGFSYDVQIERKQLELLREVAPRARKLGLLDDGFWIGERVTRQQLAEYEGAFGVTIAVMSGGSPADMPRLVASELGRAQDAWLIPVHNHTANGRRELIDALRAVRQPAIYGRTFFVEAGGLISYQEVVASPMRVWHEILRTILSGTPPGDIPVRRPREFELALNVGEAKRLGIALPPTLVKRADKVFGA